MVGEGVPFQLWPSFGLGLRVLGLGFDGWQTPCVSGGSSRSLSTSAPQA